MSTYRIYDTVVKSENASQSWEEATRFDGSNRISIPTGSQWNHQNLYRSKKGRYWLESWSQWQGSTPHAEWMSDKAAAAWLLQNGHELPEDLAELAQEVSE